MSANANEARCVDELAEILEALMRECSDVSEAHDLFMVAIQSEPHLRAFVEDKANGALVRRAIRRGVVSAMDDNVALAAVMCSVLKPTIH